jgi:hypothetical protein
VAKRATRLRRHRIGRRTDGEKGPSTINFCPASSATTTTHSQEVGSGRDRCSEILALALKQSPIHLYGAAVWIFTDNQLSRRDEMASVQKDRSITCVCVSLYVLCYIQTHTGWLLGKMKKDCRRRAHTHIQWLPVQPRFCLACTTSAQNDCQLPRVGLKARRWNRPLPR